VAGGNRWRGAGATPARERAHAGGASGLRPHAAVARDRPGAIPAAVKEHEDARGVAAGHDRPLTGYAIQIDRRERDVIRHRPDSADLVEALAPLGPADGSRLGPEQSADRVDLVLAHGSASARCTA